MAKKPPQPAAPAPDTSTEPAPPAPTDTADAPAADVEQPEPAQPEATAEPQEPAPPAPTVDAPAPPLDDYIAHHEKAAQAVDLVLTAISHPDAKPRHHIGVYSGFPIVAGPLSATYNDGSTH